MHHRDTRRCKHSESPAPNFGQGQKTLFAPTIYRYGGRGVVCQALFSGMRRNGTRLDRLSMTLSNPKAPSLHGVLPFLTAFGASFRDRSTRPSRKEAPDPPAAEAGGYIV